jgi:hypothetical protein
MNLKGLAVVFAFAAGFATAAHAAEPVKVGEINSYSRIPAFTLPYRNGWELAVEQINAAGGVLNGRPLQIVARDDAGTPEQALTAANELVRREKVALLAGTYLSNVGLAVSDYAARHKVVYLASEPLTDALTWSEGTPYTFRLRPSTYVQTAILAREAAKLPAKRWATIAPNYEYGQAAVRNFKDLLKAARPDVEFVGEQWPALFKLEAGRPSRRWNRPSPTRSSTSPFPPTCRSSCARARRAACSRTGPVVSLLTGEPDYLVPLGAGNPGRLDRHRLSVGGDLHPRPRRLRIRLSRPVPGRPAHGLPGRLQHGPGAEGGDRPRRIDQDRRPDSRAEGTDLRFALRPGHLPRLRPPVHHGRLGRQDRPGERPGPHGGLALRRWGGGSARRRSGEKTPPGGEVAEEKTSRRVSAPPHLPFVFSPRQRPSSIMPRDGSMALRAKNKYWGQRA